MSSTTQSRPQLSPGLPVAEFDAQEWRKDELTAFARVLGIPSSGTKAAIAGRVRKVLMRKALDALKAAPPTPETYVGSDAPTSHAEASVPAVAPAVAIAPSTVPIQIDDVTTASSPTNVPAQPAFFRAADGVPRARALADWFASRKNEKG